jgi:exopolysaccharide production protein ExoZ
MTGIVHDRPLLSIQYLRGIAACMVVSFHAFVQLAKFGIPTPYSVSVLSSGVDIFFIISGFVMWYTTYGRVVGPIEFYRHRIIRIVPLYWVMTTVMLAVLVVHPSSLQSSRFELPHVISSYLFVPFEHPIRHRLEPLLFPGWTLNYEMFFYLIFGALLLIQKPKLRLAVLCCTFTLLVAMQPFVHARELAFYTQSLILEFAAGSVLAFAFMRGAKVSATIAIIAIVAGAFLMLAAFWEAFPLPAGVTRGIPAFLIVGGAIYLERSKGARGLFIPRLLGDASYSTYLVHPIPQSAMTQAMAHIVSAPGPLWCSIIVVSETLISVGVGILSYFYVERPLLTILRPKRNRGAASLDAAAIMESRK